MKFYKCEHCGNIVMYVENKNVPVSCCGTAMKELVPNTVDAAAEKHVPVVTVDGNKVTAVVGEVTHPMIPEHYIMWIAIETNKGSQIKYLKPNEAPEAEFMLAEGETLVATYEYCNLHGLWVKKTVY